MYKGLTFVHQQAALLGLLLVSLVVCNENHLQAVGLCVVQVVTVPFDCHADGAVVAIVGALPGLSLDERVSEES